MGRSSSQGIFMNITDKTKINLLKQIEGLSYSDFLRVKTGDEEYILLIDWTISGLIESSCNNDGEESLFFSIVLNFEGKELLRELQSKTSIGLIRGGRFKIYAWLATFIIAPVIVFLIINSLKKFFQT